MAPARHAFEENHWSAKGWSNTREPFSPYSARAVGGVERSWEANARPRIASGQTIHLPSLPAVAAQENRAGFRAETSSNSVFAGNNGEVFRAAPNRQWEANTSKGWQNASQSPAFRSEAPTLNREQTARNVGSQRVEHWQSSGGFQPSSSFQHGGGSQPSGGFQHGGGQSGGNFQPGGAGRGR